MLKHVPHEFLNALQRLYNDVLYTGEPPTSWSKTLFTSLPKKLRTKQVTDFRPTANLRLLYNVFAYLLLGRLEHVLDAKNLKNSMVSVQNDGKYIIGQSTSNWISSLAYQLGLVQGV